MSAVMLDRPEKDEEVETTGETHGLPVDLCSHPDLWFEAWGSDPKNKIMNTSSQSRSPLQGGWAFYTSSPCLSTVCLDLVVFTLA